MRSSGNRPKLEIRLGDHSFITLAKLSEKLTFLTPLMRTRFSENFAKEINE